MTITDDPTIVRPDTADDLGQLVNPLEETDDPNIKAHIINPPNNLHIWKIGMSTKDVLDIARANQIEVVALCGHVFIPKHNPENCDACEPCFKIAGDLMGGAGE